jgi:hypothetical protein
MIEAREIAESLSLGIAANAWSDRVMVVYVGDDTWAVVTCTKCVSHKEDVKADNDLDYKGYTECDFDVHYLVHSVYGDKTVYVNEGDLSELSSEFIQSIEDSVVSEITEEW